MLLLIGIFILVLVIIIFFQKGGPDENQSLDIERYENSPIKNLIKRGAEKSLVKDYASAIAIADQVLFLDDKNIKAYRIRAGSLETMNFNLDAIDDYEAAIKLGDLDPNTFGLLGLLYRKIGELEKGQFYLKKSIDANGPEMYKIMYDVFLNSHDALIEILTQSGKEPQNYLRRGSKMFFDDLTEVDKTDLYEATSEGLSLLTNKDINWKLLHQSFKERLFELEEILAMNPENHKIRRLYDFARNPLD